ncbi:PAS domain-containing sensor histidine kinase [Sphingomonas sp. Leaf17]|uniref:sensor histidine kinase n=1 Tax=Sphingomonas sp. Leaf17 TaxID=1735683 RepID=UPI0006F91D89|nr:ATP-binding protein [Sphingomonas sp. Leaf17]KQM65881.1 PAS domain-containing sensor histidine kinase [Sphingomonas sp. Leaf17]
MIAAASPDYETDEPRSGFTVTPLVEVMVLAIVIAVAVASYYAISHSDTPQGLIEPALVAGLLVANLVPGIALMMLIGRRVAKRRAARSLVGGQGELHVRLVAIFSLVAAIPMLLVTIGASLLFQYGVQFWYSDRARGVFENAIALTRVSYNQTLQRWEEATVTMGNDLAGEIGQRPIDRVVMKPVLGGQLFLRGLSEGAILSLPVNGRPRVDLEYNEYGIDMSKQLNPEMVSRLRAGQRSVVNVQNDRIKTVVRLPGKPERFLYAARVTDPGQFQDQTELAEAAFANYKALLVRARSLQLQFNAALLILSLLIVGIAVWIALAVADRLVRPVGELVDAARRVAGGDLTARVTGPRTRDEVGTLASAFNQMTGRIQQQNTALVAANDQLENRRALIEAVMTGVSAGVIATGGDRRIQIANRSALDLLGTDQLVGRPLAQVSSELDDLIDSGAREAIVQVMAGEEARTLAVRIARTDAGPILTFDDITQQLIDQRRAAWSDVARRIAHEIKNPLTPIQLAAERLQRRYGSKLEQDDGTFARLTDTIVRQVGDLRRMVDEFSSFARMPKPVFREESLLDAARQALFLHEVAHPTIRFVLRHDDDPPTLVCDRRQISQALTNIVKNAVEAIEAVGPGGGQGGGEIVLTLARPSPTTVNITVADTGIGLPAERDRIVEPYMTTRARGTGLGLAIVKKIVEEHLGTLAFTDRAGGGTVVTMTFDASGLLLLDQGDAQPEQAGEGQLAALTRIRT